MLLWVNAEPGPGPGPLAMGGNFFKKRVLEKNDMSHLEKGFNFHTRGAFRPTITGGGGGAEAPPQGQYIF